MHSRILAISTGWNSNRAQVHPQPGSVDVLPDMGDEGEQQETDAPGQEEVPVAVEVPGPADERPG